MREQVRETKLARRLSQHIPKSTLLPQHQGSLSSASPTTHASSSPERPFKRTSLQQGIVSPLPTIPQQQSLDPTATRKKIDSEPELDPTSVFNQHDNPVSTQSNGMVSSATAATTGSLPPLNTSFNSSGTINPTNSSLGSPSHPGSINTSSRNTPPLSAGTARTRLGSILANNLGLTRGPGSPISPTSSRHFKYPSIPSPTSPSPTISGDSTDVSTTHETSTTHLPPLRKSSLMSDPEKNEKLGSGYSNSHTPSVFINIGKTTSSLPQILMPKKRIAQNIVSNMGYIGAWYFFSTALSIYNKNLMGKDNWNFNLPLFVSSIHAGLHFVITACLMHFFPDIFDATRSGKGGRITIRSYVTQVVPCATAAALEICMANASLMFITLSFYTMIKSSTPIWVLIFAFFFRLEKPRMSLILIIGVIVIGVVLTVAGETQFDLTGFILVLFAAIMSGLRWSLTQMLLQKDQLGMDNPVATLYYISPIMFVIMSILSLIIEDPFVQFASSEFFDDFWTGMTTLLMAAGGGFLAFAMTVAEFKLIKNTGTVTLSVAGISKEIVVISLSMLIFGDRLTFVNLLGLLVSIGGILAYNYDKIKKLQQTTLGTGDYKALGPMGRHHKGDNTD